MFWDLEVFREEIENWVEVSFDVGGENMGAHPKNLGQVLFLYAFGLKEGDYGLD